jgi:putative transposase
MLRSYCPGVLSESAAPIAYAGARAERDGNDSELLIHAIRQRLPRLGGRKLFYLIQAERSRLRIHIGRDRFFTLLRMHGLLSHRSRAFVVRTTNSRHRHKRYTNLIHGMKPDRPDQVWVADITYLVVPRHFLYLSLITDAYSHKIVGYAGADTLEREGPLQALPQALNGRKGTADGTGEPLIHHSDRGSQYCSDDYTDILNIKEFWDETVSDRFSPL